MDFNRSSQGQPNQARPTSAAAGQAVASHKNDDGGRNSRLHRWGQTALLVSGTLLIIALIFFIAFGKPSGREASLVNKDLYQAVFVNVNGTNGGQVYFGKVNSLTSQYIRLTNVFYIQNQADGQNANASYNLVKLGCELHGPTDEMVINREEVFFWENLKTDGQVSQKIAEWKKQNPNGQKCETNSGSTQQSSGSTQQSGAGGQGGTTQQATPAPAPAPAPAPTATPPARR